MQSAYEHPAPPVPSEPQKRQTFLNVWRNEVRIFRKHPGFILGMIMAVISSMTLLILTDGLVGRLAILLGTFGVACVYDTVVRHFCGVLSERQQMAATASESDH